MIEISDAIRQCCPTLQLGLLKCEVNVRPSDDALLNHIEKHLNEIQETLKIEQISQLPVAKQTRQGYKATGKDPARYRPSAEALLRRVVKGNGLYQINNIVDVLNLVSVKTAFSIGGYDLEKVAGQIQLGIGEPDEPYQGIGRGVLNIDRLPVLRDEQGAFGSPTSDSARTSVTAQTKQFMMVFFAFTQTEALLPAIDLATKWLAEFTEAKNFETSIV